jgi:hypothetical protein
MPGMRRGPTRREFLGTGAIAGAGLALGWPATHLIAQPVAPADGLAFFVISDTHMLADSKSPGMIDGARWALNERLVGVLNTLPGQPLPAAIGGGRVAQPRAVLHLGDIADSGDKLGAAHEQMTATEWAAHTRLYGLTGTEGPLRYPMYEVHGNHDTPRAANVVLQGLIARNARRRGLTAISSNGLHYSWDWDGIHFVALGIVVGANLDDLPISRYGSYDSLAFLVEDLHTHVAGSGRPVIVLQHVDLQRYSVACDDAVKGGSRAMCCEGMAKIAWHSKDCPKHADGISMSEWSACDVRAYHRALAPYNVAAIFHGHLHARRTDVWDGLAVGASQGIPVFGAKNAGAGGVNRAFFYCRIEGAELVVREYQSSGEEGWSRDRSEIRWEPRLWRVPLQRTAAMAQARAGNF